MDHLARQRRVDRSRITGNSDVQPELIDLRVARETSAMHHQAFDVVLFILRSNDIIEKLG